MTIFYLVRHAHANWTPDEDRPLSARGRVDAVHVADILEAFEVGAIYASPYRRARQTIAPLATRLSLPVHLEPGLCERKLSGGVVGDFFTAVEATWRDPFFAHPGGESNAAAQRRGVAVVRRLQEQHGTEHVVLSTHGILLTLIVRDFDASIKLAFWKSLTMPDLYTLRLGREGGATIHRLWQGSKNGQHDSCEP